MKLDFTNKEYTISVYKNELTGTREEREGIVYDSYYKQIKIAQIGSNQYKSPIDACTPKFSKNINGKKTLTFNMYYEYYDYDFGDFLINPFVGLIHNDTLIQLKYENEFYDFLVTKVQKDSENKVYSFTAEDSTIIELGKNGFNAELNIELENNMGTIKELGTEVLKDSDWIVDPGSDLIVQTLEDSLYKISIELSANDFIRRTNYLPDAYYIHDASIHDYSEQSINDNIYVFYNDVVDTTKNEIGFLYWGDESQVVLNADGVVVNSYNYVITNPAIVAEIRKSTKLALSLMHGYRVIRSPKTSYNHDLEKVVNYFTKNGEETEYYGYAVTDYMTPVLTENYISNPCNMTTLYDWNYVNHGEKTNTRPKLLWQAMPRPECAPYVSYLKVEPNTEVINKGLQGHRSNLESFAYGDKFIIAFLARTDGYENYGVFPGEETSAMDITDGGQFKPTELQGLQYSMAFYRYKEPTQSDIIKFAELGEGQDIEVEEVLCSGTFVPNPNQSFTIEDTLFPGRSKVYYYNEFSYEGEPITDLTEHLDKTLGFFIKTPVENQFYEVMVFRKIEYDGKIVYPGRIFTGESDTDLRTPFCRTYYNIYKTGEDGKPVICDRILDMEDYQMVYNEDCEKICSIDGKESNYYTLLSNLTKTFGCWMEPIIERDEDGNIIYTTHYYGPNGELLYTSDSMEKDQVTYNWKSINLSVVENDVMEYEYNGKLTPIKEVSYIEKFEKFAPYKNGNEYKNIPEYLIKDKYDLNYIYIVDYEGEDVSSNIGHPRKEYYILEKNYNTETIEATYAINKPIKKIKFRKYLNETPNWAGFKYGINVKSIQRSEDNSKFATKVIVKNNNNEFALNGNKFCTIANAVNNPTRDNFILDFSYYIRQGMLDKTEVTNDLENNFYPEIRRYNTENEQIIDRYSHQTTALDKIRSEYETYYLAYNAAWENIYDYCKKLENCGEEYAITTKNEDGTWNFSNWNFGGLCAIKEKTALLCYAASEEEMVNSVSSEIFAGVEFSDATQYDMEWYELPVVYVNNNKYYTFNGQTKKVEGYTGNHDYFYVFVGEEHLEEAFGKDTEIKNHCTYYGYPNHGVLYHNKSDYYWNKALYGYACRIDEDLLKANVYGPMYKNKAEELEEIKAQMDIEVKSSIEKVNTKKGLLRRLFSKYSDFIRESSWIQDSYVDDELYYLDARDSLHTAAQPQISYTINVVDIEELDRFSAYKLRVGDYTFVEDTEFFGWDIHKRPAKEWVVVTEATYDLEQPANNQIKVQNYKTQLEDLLSRLSANLQQLELNKGGYNREIYNDRLPANVKSDDTGIYSNNYNPKLNSGWALFSDGTWYLGNLSKI